MQFAFLLYNDENEWESFPDSQKREVVGAHMAFRQALGDAGALVYGAPLDSSRVSQRVRRRDGRVSVEDGPFTDAKEQIGGLYLIEADDLDAALDWAARCPSASYGRIEVRPLWDAPSKG